MFKFLKQVPAAVPVSAASPAVAEAAGAVAETPLAPAKPAAFTLGVNGSADIEPLAGVIGMEDARAALAGLETAQPRAILFAAAPRTAAHREALTALLGDVASRGPAEDAVVAVQDFASGGVAILRLPVGQARQLAERVEDAVAMLAITVPAAFSSDSYAIARATLDEELRSGHDGAIDALKRRALAQNIGLLRTPQGYAVAPMHEGRVVSPEVFNALPGGLKSDVETKLATFERELALVLKDRSVRQQAFRTRLTDLDREVASLAVEAAMATVRSGLGAPAATAYLEALATDLTRNFALFLAGTRDAGRITRAPVEIAADPRLARYRVNILAPSGASAGGVEVPETLDRADLAGQLLPAAGAVPAGTVSPAALTAGALTRAGRGIVLIDAADLLAQYSVWPLLKAALRSGQVSPADANGRAAGASAGLAPLPVACRVVVTGETADYLAWRRLDPDVGRLVRLVDVFSSAMAVTGDGELRFARHVAGIVAEGGFQPLDGGALAEVIRERSATAAGASALSTDLDAVREIVTAASLMAKARGGATTDADDVRAAARSKRELLARFEEAPA